MAETIGIISFDEWLTQNGHDTLPETILGTLRNQTSVKFCAAPTVLDELHGLNTSVPIISRVQRFGSVEELVGALETVSFSYIYRITEEEDGSCMVRATAR